MVLSAVTRPSCDAIFGGNRLRVRTARATSAAAAASATGRRGNRAADEDQHVVLRVQVPGVELRRVDAAERELELLEDPARPARTRASRRTDPTGRCAARAAAASIAVDHPAAERGLRAAAIDARASAASPVATDPVVFAPTVAADPAASRRLTAVNASLPRAIDENPAAGGTRAHRRLDVPLGHLLERAGDRLEHAIELHAHLERERPAGVVVGPGRRRARIREVVRDDPAARTCRGRADGTPGWSSPRTSRPDSACRWPGRPRSRGGR